MGNKNNSKIVIVLSSIIIVILTVLCILFATDTISFNNNSTNSNQQNMENNQTNTNNSDNQNKVIQTKLVDNLDCNNSETTFNNITVKIEQEKDDMMCSINSIMINDKDIKGDVAIWIDSYEIYDNNVIILSKDTSGSLFTIYSLENNSSIIKLEPNTLNGYWVTSYTTNNNKITINGKECGAQCGMETTGYPNATFEIKYNNNSFTYPKLIERK